TVWLFDVTLERIGFLFINVRYLTFLPSPGPSRLSRVQRETRPGRGSRPGFNPASTMLEDGMGQGSLAFESGVALPQFNGLPSNRGRNCGYNAASVGAGHRGHQRGDA